jgi:hypothetical protein
MVAGTNLLQEESMRAVLPLALVFALAGAVEAQEVPQSGLVVEAAEAVQPVQAYQPKPALEKAPRLQPTPIQDAGAQGVDANQQQTESRSADAMAMRQAPGTVNWWWLVAAIVVAGLIIVAIT